MLPLLWATSSFQKIIMSLEKVAHLVKNWPIWSPCLLNYRQICPKTVILKHSEQSDQKFCPNLEKRSHNSRQANKWQNFLIKAQFESSKHLHQTAFESLKYLQQAMLRNCKKIALEKSSLKCSPKCSHFLRLLLSSRAEFTYAFKK